MTLTLPVTRSLRERDVRGAADAVPAPERRTLAGLPVGASGTVLGVCDDARPDVARRLFDLGFAPGAEVTLLRTAPLADPVVVRVADYELTLRRAQARCIVLDGPGAVPTSAGRARHAGGCGLASGCAGCEA